MNLVPNWFRSTKQEEKASSKERKALKPFQQFFPSLWPYSVVGPTDAVHYTRVSDSVLNEKIFYFFGGHVSSIFFVPHTPQSIWPIRSGVCNSNSAGEAWCTRRIKRSLILNKAAKLKELAQFGNKRTEAKTLPFYS